MINLRLAGGLGNQLFQLAAASILSSKWHLPIVIDTSGMGSYATARDLSIDQIIDLEVHGIDISLIKGSCVSKSRISRFFGGSFIGCYFINDRNFMSAVKSISAPKKVFMDGYFIESVSQEIFESAVSLLLPNLKVRSLKTVDECAIHVRGGDFLDLNWSMKNPGNYYHSGIREVISKKPDIKFTIVTDDIEYARKILPVSDVSFTFTKGDLFSDFSTLVNSKYAVISNSTFAFWARAFASLATDESETIAPTFWRPEVRRELLLPNEKL